ncbi:PLD nuclease N-terminal domain-containing protein [Methanocaldococcus sp.]|uniref:PLD nuclease N-terminal domain-containing protein n=1 Tax=Methanocaldococcus sp. TaxID=2152917 RepID=UPI0026172DF1|nr:PLD nuclease N-terminal domain-containing protein [Methanocaldococcus sp.]MCQ6253676.1 PLD nuclease N-terminal domain-containing protein [Methanocaldococcus sp.]
MWYPPMCPPWGYNYGFYGFPFFNFAFFGFIWWIIKIFVFIIVVLDIIKRDDLKTIEKILWLLVVWFLGIIGAIIYFLLSKRENKQNNK